MRILSTYFNVAKSIVPLCFLLLSSLIRVQAFELIEDADPDETDVWELTLEENVNYPKIPGDVSKKVKSLINTQYTQLQAKYKDYKKQGFDVRLKRNDEVIKVTMPADQFFGKNAYNFNTKNGERYFAPLLPYLRIKEFYRVVISIHHDNSLSDNEANELTYNRVLSLTDWLSYKSANALGIVPYSMGNDYPVSRDNSSKSRAKNRRIEIFIFPGKTMIDLAKENKL